MYPIVFLPLLVDIGQLRRSVDIWAEFEMFSGKNPLHEKADHCQRILETKVSA